MTATGGVGGGMGDKMRELREGTMKDVISASERGKRQSLRGQRSISLPGQMGRRTSPVPHNLQKTSSSTGVPSSGTGSGVPALNKDMYQQLNLYTYSLKV